MANVLKMTIVQSILSLHAQGWSQRRIADQLGIDRETVSRYVRLARSAVQPNPSDLSKPAIAPIDPVRVSGGFKPCPPAPIGSGAVGRATVRRGRSSFWPSMARDYRPSGFIRTCAPSRVRSGSATTAYGGSSSGWERCESAPVRRLECAPGQEAQVDFGTGAAVIGPDGQRRRTHVFRIVLSHSRKAYSEACFRQTTEDFLRASRTPSGLLAACPRRS